jgi:hypothetical protein
MRGFLFEHTRSDITSPDAVERTKIAVIADTRTQAFALAAQVLPRVGLRLTDEGREALKIAMEADVGPGEAKAID